jgi:anti-sigma regulatory factor (Ser/Thr protein kinase)
MRSAVLVRIEDESSIGEARRAAARLASQLGFDEVRAGELAIITTEAARNALVHGGGGEVVISEKSGGAEIIALDSGKGIADMGRAMSDGFTTSNTPGTGLGAIRRIASKLELFSYPEQGTVLVATVENAGPSEPSPEVAGISVAIGGETICGDAWDLASADDRLSLLVIDGLGHGQGAHEAALEGVATFRKHWRLGPGECLRRMHDALKKTRGAAAAIAEIRQSEHRVVYGGVGNIHCVVFGDQISRALVNMNGTLGHSVSRINEFTAEWISGMTLVMSSDGLTSRYDLTKYSGILKRKPALIAGLLFRDFRRHRDDATVVVLKESA